MKFGDQKANAENRDLWLIFTLYSPDLPAYTFKPMTNGKRFLIMTFFIVLTGACAAQDRLITGIVTDSASNAPLQNVSITFRGSSTGGVTNASGKFSIKAETNVRVINVSITGYRSKTITLSSDPEQNLNIRLVKLYTTLGDVFVSGKKGKYRNKNNPAVDLIKKVIANRSKNGPFSSPFASWHEYEKTRLFTDGPWVKATHNFVLKKFQFFFENLDSTVAEGKTLNAVYIQEVNSNNFVRHEPRATKKIVTGFKSVDYGEFVDMRGISQAIHFLYDDINIYDNNITAFTLQFVSPIADIAPTLYMYFIRDTLVENGSRIVKLYFTPRNPEDQLFRGVISVNIDQNYAVTAIELGLSKHSNLNFVRNFQVNQRFEKDSSQHYHLSSSVLRAFLSPFPNTPGMFGERAVTISQLSDSGISDLVFKGPAIDSLANSSKQTDSFWTSNRPSQLTHSELKTYQNADSLVKMKSFHRLMDLSTLYFVGYKSAGKFDIGPIQTFYAFNSVEGHRFQFAGRTNYKLSKRLYFDGYLGYGLKDRSFKYKMTGTYAFNNRSIYSYPFNYLQASYSRDLKNPGQEDLFSNGNSFLSSFSRGYNGNWLYSDIFRLSYVREFGNHFSFILGTQYWRQQPAGSLFYVKQPIPAELDTIPQLTTGSVSIGFRWAPKEEFFENKLGRRSLANKYPVFDIQYSKGIKGLFGGEYNYSAIRLTISKRAFISPLGFSDIRFDTRYLFGTLPFPLLIIHPANRSFYYSSFSYNLMNVEEFVSDHYAGFNIDHYFNGFFFNKVPLLKKLRLREVLAAKLLYGGLRNENNPAFNSNQFLFPSTNGVTSTFTLNGQPYFEASVGIYNIFSVFRIDLVKRFSYLSHPNISKLGLLVSSNFAF